MSNSTVENIGARRLQTVMEARARRDFLRSPGRQWRDHPDRCRLRCRSTSAISPRNADLSRFYFVIWHRRPGEGGSEIYLRPHPEELAKASVSKDGRQSTELAAILRDARRKGALLRIEVPEKLLSLQTMAAPAFCKYERRMMIWVPALRRGRRSRILARCNARASAVVIVLRLIQPLFFRCANDSAVCGGKPPGA